MTFRLTPYCFLIHALAAVRTITAGAIGFMVVGGAPLAALAESVSFLNTSLPVDRIVDVDATHVNITLGADNFITLKDEAGVRVAGLYAAKPELARVLPWTNFTTLVTTAAGGADRDFAKVASHGALTSKELSDDEVSEFLVAITTTSSGRKIITEEVTAQTAPSREESVCVALAYVGAEGAQLKNVVTSSLAWMQQSCPAVLQRACQKAFQAGDPETAQRYFDVVRELFSADIPTVNAVNVASDRWRSARDAFRSGNFEKFEASLRVVSMDPILKGGFSTVAPTMTLAFAQKQLEEKHPDRALRAVSALDFSLRSNAHHELLSKILSALTVEDASVFSVPAVQKALWSYASKDEAIKRAYIELLSRFIREVAVTPKADLGVVLLSNLRELRPDPSTENNELRVVLGEGLIKQGQRDVGNKLLAEAGSSAPSAFTWWRILIPLAIGGIGTFVVSAFLRRGSKDAGAVEQKETDKQQFVAESDDASESRKAQSSRNFVSYTRNIAAMKELSEYEELLEKFNLQVGAKSSDIKLAYRNAVKSYHPDLNPHGGHKEADMFISITKIYERLLELHQEREKRGQS